MIDYKITNEYGYKNDYSYLDSLIKRIFKHEHIKNATLSIVLVGNEKIQELNKNYRGIDRITDVISFAFEETDGLVYNNMRALGEIYICIPRMIEQAQDYGHSEVRELAFLTCHGILHLLGYDHMTEEEEKVMFALQEKMLDEDEKTRKERD